VPTAGAVFPTGTAFEASSARHGRRGANKKKTCLFPVVGVPKFLLRKKKTRKFSKDLEILKHGDKDIKKSSSKIRKNRH